MEQESLLRCSFCNKSQREVKKLIKGPKVFICEECVDICVDIITEELGREAEGKVFLVHGHDNGAVHEIARFLERLKLEVIVLREQPNVGSTIIEKLLEHSNVSYAVVLLTPDDVGASLSASLTDQHHRARQNVILELGYFLGKLGRKRVTVLYRSGIEIPSDYSGVLFVPLDEVGAWRLALAREIKVAGLKVDLNTIV